MELQWIRSLIERERALLADMLVQLNSVGRVLADRNGPRAGSGHLGSGSGHLAEPDAQMLVEAVTGRLKADDERLGVLAQHVAQMWNGERA